jgi:exonuclease SbcC
VRIETVTARAFGPFANKTLPFAPGLTVIFGPNESGKSSWHAALYAAVCGMRRGRGAGRKEDRDFAERHRPWNLDSWEVSAVVRLDDGRQIELHNDLDGRVDCRATDAVLGRDVSAEIMHEGTPDASRWLGLERHSFLAVACVRQADVLGVLDDPDMLQVHLQRAADTAGADATATAAISAIEGFSREHVGQDRVNSTKPLHQAVVQLETAKRGLERANAQHSEFLQLVARVDELAAGAETCAHRLRVIQAARAVQEATKWQARLNRASELAAKYPEGPPVGLVAEDTLAQEVATSLNAWEARPAVPSLQGPTAAQLRVRIQALPALPSGDLAPHASVTQKRQDYERAQQAMEIHERNRPPSPEVIETAGLSDDELRALALEMETPVPAVDPALSERANQAKARLDALPSRGRQRAIMIIGAVIAAAGLAGVAFGWLIAGLLVALAGIVTVMWTATQSGDAARVSALEELRNAEQSLGEQQHAAKAAVVRREAAAKSATDKQLPADPVVLRELSAKRVQADRMQADLATWTKSQSELAEEFRAAEEQLTAVLRSRGIEANGNVLAATRGYESSCAERARIAAEAGKRPGLEAQLADREAAERAANEAATRRQEAEEKLRAVATECAVDGDDDEQRAQALRLWQQQRAAALEELELQRTEWGELQNLLDGGTLEELAGKANQRVSEAERLRAQVPADELAAAQRKLIEDQEVESVRQISERANAAAERARGQVEDRSRQLTSVAEVEEALTAAEAELARVQRLDHTLDLTLQFLKQAEERVHRDISRVLADTIRPWLPTVTANRYSEILVDPASLAIQVRGFGGTWRNAAWLSHGTAEQVYLLLRMALAKHLTKPGETCPLILDDITVQCDRGRKQAVLDLLHAISRERQVILFSQEDEVLAWAESNVTDPQDHVERLEVVSEC